MSVPRASIADVDRRGTAGLAERTATPVYRLLPSESRGITVPVLDPTQQEVVDHPGGPLLVLAGPGTGKTTTIVEAVAARIAAGVDPEQILVLTFSRKAAAELRAAGHRPHRADHPRAARPHVPQLRLRRAAPGGAVLRGEPAAAAAHGRGAGRGRCAELLRGDAEQEGAVRWPRRADPGARHRRLRAANCVNSSSVRPSAGIGPSAWPGGGATWRGRTGWLAGQLPGAVRGGHRLRHRRPGRRLRVRPGRARPRGHRRARRRPGTAAAGARAGAAGCSSTSTRTPIRRRSSCCELLAGGGGDLVAVGDPDQSIYGFRGAEPRGISDFPERFRHRDGRPARTVPLRLCRRSGAELLAVTPAGDRRGRPGRGRTAALDGRRGRRRPAGPRCTSSPVGGSWRPRTSPTCCAVRTWSMACPGREMAVVVRSAGVAGAPAPGPRPGGGSGGRVRGTTSRWPSSRPSRRSCTLLRSRCAADGPADATEAGLDEPAAEALLASPLGGAAVLDLRRLRRRRPHRADLPRHRPDGARRAARRRARRRGPLLDAVPEDVARPASKVDRRARRRRLARGRRHGGGRALGDVAAQRARGAVVAGQRAREAGGRGRRP